MLVSLVYTFAPDEIINTLMILIDRENEAHNNIFIIEKIENCWDDRLARSIYEKVQDDHLKPSNMGCLLRMLLSHNVRGINEYAESLINSCQPIDIEKNTDRYEKSVISASILMEYSADRSWVFIWPKIQQDIEFGCKVITNIANAEEFGGKNVCTMLDEDQVKELYIWIEKHYPHSEDPKHEGAFCYSDRDYIVNFRDNILQQLKERGTEQSCDAIDEIIHLFPSYEWLNWILIDARSITNQKTWIPPKSRDILNMAQDSKKHLVQNGEQFLEVLIESLQRLEERLQGETPAAVFLWDECEGKYRPKSENRFSDYIKLFLKEDLKQNKVIVNREVEIRTRIGESGSSGERTDIHLDAFTAGEKADVLSVIIEVKGCWNQELNTAMQTQLVDRYLNDNPGSSGLYLIGMFNCKQWDYSDSRKKHIPTKKYEELQQEFDNQATLLSKNGTCVKAFIMNTSLR